MRAKRLLSIGSAAMIWVVAGCAEHYATFGEPMQVKPGDAIAVGKVLDAKDAYQGKDVLVKGTVREVCEHRGCWITLGEPGSNETIFVKFTCPLEGRLVPMDAVGHEAIVRGTLAVEEITEDEARHTAEDAGAPADEIAKIVGPQKRVRIASPAARIIGLQQPAEGA